MPKLYIKSLNNKIIVTGKTYEYREQFKELGGVWDPNQKCWTFNSDLFTVIDDFIYTQNNVKKEKLCGICRQPGHNRSSCGIVCDYCKEKHYETDCQLKRIHLKTLSDPNYKRLQNNCYCKLEGVCVFCKYMRCNDAKTINCVGSCCFECKTHNRRECHGNHE